MIKDLICQTAMDLLGSILEQLGLLLPPAFLKKIQERYVYQPSIKKIGDTVKVPLFNTVFFEVRTRCNNSCPFCAASVQNEIRKDREMPIELYHRVINELQEIGFNGRVAYHVNNDPLLFDKLIEFVVYARKKLSFAWIQILTNGKALTEDVAEKLIAAGINELSINIYSDNMTLRLPPKFQNIYDNRLPLFYKKYQIKKGHGPDLYNKKIFRFNVMRRKLNIIKTSRAGTAPNKKEKSSKPRGYCEHPFTQLNITTDGTVSKCSADFYFSDPMGNVNNASLREIWYGEKFQQVRRHLLIGHREAIITCKNCDYYGVKRCNSLDYYGVKRCNSLIANAIRKIST